MDFLPCQTRQFSDTFDILVCVYELLLFYECDLINKTMCYSQQLGTSTDGILCFLKAGCMISLVVHAELKFDLEQYDEIKAIAART